MFGLTPEEVLMQQRNKIDTQANNYAKLDPFQRANSMLYKGGAGLAGMGAEAMGMVNPQVAKSNLMQQIVASSKMDTPEDMVSMASKLHAAGFSNEAAQIIASARDWQLKKAQSEFADKKALYEGETPDTLLAKKYAEAPEGSALKEGLKGILDKRGYIPPEKAAPQEKTITIQRQMADGPHNIMVYTQSGSERDLGLAVPKAGKDSGISDPAKTANAEKSIDELLGYYKDLYKGGGITSTGRSDLQNLSTSMGQSSIGRVVGRTIGNENQATRDKIEALRPSLIPMLMASGVKASMMNSNVELQNAMKTFTDPNVSMEANLATLARLDRTYGNGNMAPKIEETMNMISGKGKKPNASGAKFLGFE
jgi:hypothetical protein